MSVLLGLCLLLPSGPLELACEQAPLGGAIAIRRSLEGSAGVVRELVARVGGRAFRRERLEPGELWLVAAPPSDGRVAEPGATFVPAEVSLTWLEGRVPRAEALSLLLARMPESAVPPGALARIVTFNPAVVPDSARYVEVSLAGQFPGDLCVRDAGADPVPAAIERTRDGLRVCALTSVPADYARCLFLCEGADAAPPTDLVCGGEGLGSGHGRLRIATGSVTVELEEDIGTPIAVEVGGTGAPLVRASVGRCRLTLAAGQSWLSIEGPDAASLAGLLAGRSGLRAERLPPSEQRWALLGPGCSIGALRRPPLTVVERLSVE